jgi:hypothetical protein
MDSIEAYQALAPRDFEPGEPIELTALVELAADGIPSAYFIGPRSGSLEITLRRPPRQTPSRLRNTFVAEIAAAEEREFPSVGHGTDHRCKAKVSPAPPWSTKTKSSTLPSSASMKPTNPSKWPHTEPVAAPSPNKSAWGWPIYDRHTGEVDQR